MSEESEPATLADVINKEKLKQLGKENPKIGCDKKGSLFIRAAIANWDDNPLCNIEILLNDIKDKQVPDLYKFLSNLYGHTNNYLEYAERYIAPFKDEEGRYEAVVRLSLNDANELLNLGKEEYDKFVAQVREPTDVDQKATFNFNEVEGLSDFKKKIIKVHQYVTNSSKKKK